MATYRCIRCGAVMEIEDPRATSFCAGCGAQQTLVAQDWVPAGMAAPPVPRPETVPASQMPKKKSKKGLIAILCGAGGVLVIAALVLVLTLGSSGKKRPGSPLSPNPPAAAQVGEETLDSVTFNYYYYDAVMESYDQWYAVADQITISSGMTATEAMASLFGVDFSRSLKEQTMPDADKTWHEHFLEQALAAAREDYALAAEARAQGYTLSADGQQDLENYRSNLSLYASLYGYTSEDLYIIGIYGQGTNLDSYLAYYERRLLADTYKAHREAEFDKTVFSQAELAAQEEKAPQNYDSYSYTYCYVSCTAFLESSAAEATDQELQAARQKAREAAESLLPATSVAEMGQLVYNLELNTNLTVCDETLYTDIVPQGIRDWLAEPERTEGDMGILENANSQAEISGYYVVRFASVTDNRYYMSNVRHILASDRLQAQALLEQWRAGPATEDSFAQLALEHSLDGVSYETVDYVNISGGMTVLTPGQATGEPIYMEIVGGSQPEREESDSLYENIHRGSAYVDAFRNWAMDPARWPGETEIIETEYGYHIMYYVGQSELTYREHLLNTELQAAAKADWLAQLVEGTSARLLNTENIDLAYPLA